MKNKITHVELFKNKEDRLVIPATVVTAFDSSGIAFRALSFVFNGETHVVRNEIGSQANGSSFFGYTLWIKRI